MDWYVIKYETRCGKKNHLSNSFDHSRVRVTLSVLPREICYSFVLAKTDFSSRQWGRCANIKAPIKRWFFSVAHTSGFQQGNKSLLSSQCIKVKIFPWLVSCVTRWILESLKLLTSREFFTRVLVPLSSQSTRECTVLPPAFFLTFIYQSNSRTRIRAKVTRFC